MSNFVGWTSCIVLLTKDKIYWANAGDSRAVICVNGIAKPISVDHKPESPN